MITYPDFNPVAFSIGPLPVHWYGLMYLLGFFLGWSLLAWQKRYTRINLTLTQLSDLIFFALIGVIVGGRLGYVLFYDWNYFISNPLFVFQTWKGGMSFHGGLIGVMVALFIYSYKIKKPFLDLTDLITPVVPLGLGAGRIGNFINGELWGRTTDVPWAMIFPGAGDLPRHPSQLYEGFFEGIILFIILWIFSLKKRPRGVLSGCFLLLYGCIRFGLEFLREPDPQIGLIAFGWMTEGQLLCLPMILIGFILIIWAYRENTI